MATTDIYHIAGSLEPQKPALAFLGGNVDDYIQVDALAAARTAANDTVGTIIAWVNTSDLTNSITILGFGDKNVVEFIEFNIEAGKLACRCTDGTVAQFVSVTDSVVIKRHQWHHVAVRQAANGNGPEFFVDGVKVASTNSTSTDVNEWFNNCDGIDSGRIGAANKAGDDSVTQEFKGGISSVKYYNTALTNAQILSDFNGNHLTTGCISWYYFDETLVDSVSAHNGTKVGDIVYSCSYCEWESKFRSLATFVTADYPVIAIHNGSAHCIVIKSA